MTDEHVSQMIAIICRDLGYLTTRAASDTGRLSSLVAAVRGGRAGAAWLAEATDLLRGLGIPVTLGDRGWPFTADGASVLPDLGHGTATTDLLRCPGHACNRRELRRPGAPRPHCPVFDTDLRQERDLP